MEFLAPGPGLPPMHEGVAASRAAVRAFLREELAAGRFEPRCNAWMEGFSPEFSRRLGRRGWIGHHWPRDYGGHGGSTFETLAINEELLAAGAPVAAHWIAARQSGPLLMRFGSEAQRRRFLPSIAAGELYFAIGMSEPDVGSDLASVRTRAELRGDAWVLDGRKIWSSGAHRCHYIIVLCRTAARRAEARHEGLTQMIVDLKAPGVSILPIRLLDGSHHFNEVIFEGVEVPGEMVVGAPGEGWRQVTGELAYERSGPERFLSTFPLVERYLDAVLRAQPGPGDAAAGRMLARLMTLRAMSLAIWGALDAGRMPAVEAAMVKDLGTSFEGDTLETVRDALGTDERLCADRQLARALEAALPLSPAYTLRGGTNEILRNLIAKDLQRR